MKFIKSSFLIFAILFPPTIFALNCKTLRSANVPNGKAVNIIFVPSKFKGDLNKFEHEVKRIIQVFEQYVPFKKENTLINVKISLEESKENNICYFNCNGIERLLCCDVNQAKKMSATCGTKNIQTIVVHDSTKYGGAGYRSQNLATTSINSRAPRVAIHELGHSLFKLADEYSYGNGTELDKNCDYQGCHKWGDLVDVNFPGAECTRNKCQNGDFFACGNTVMNDTRAPFKANNERIACCTFKHISGIYPSFCTKFFEAGVGLEAFCMVNSVTSILPKADPYSDKVEYFFPGDDRSGYYPSN